MERPAPIATSDVVGQKKQKIEQENDVPNPKKQFSCRLSGSSENRAFEKGRSTNKNIGSPNNIFYALSVFFFLGLNDISYSLQDTGNKEALKLESVLQPHEQTIISLLIIVSSYTVKTVYESGHN